MPQESPSRTQRMDDVDDLLTEARRILGNTKAKDAGASARARRAHARVLAMLDMNVRMARRHREQRIANLLQLAQSDADDAEWSRHEAQRMLRNDDQTSSIRPVA